MECRKVLKSLSAYLEKVVSPKQKALIDGHLKKCKKCKDELTDLKKVVEYVQKLEEVEPPAWVAQRVMAQVREEAEARRRIWQRLFRPFYIKVPLEAIALVLIAVGAIYIVKFMQPEMQLAKAPVEQKAMAPGPSTPAREKTSAVHKEQHPPTRTREQLTYGKRVTTGEEKPVEAPQPPALAARKDEGAAATGYADHAPVNRDLASLQGVRPKAAGEMQANGLHFVVKVRDLETASKDIEVIMRQLGGKAITIETYEGRAVIAVELDSHKVKEFFDQLHLIGDVQEKALALEGVEGDVEVRVEVEKESR